MPELSNALTEAQIASFIADGFVRIDHAFSEETAAACREILWKDLPVDRNDPKTWTKPVIRLNQYGQQPFREAANTPVLQAAYDQLAGAGRRAPRQTLGTFPVRFPSPDDPGDAGWHIDVSFGWEERPTDFMSWRANISSKGRLLLMLFI
ncbi:MAG: phytanoyl-CoA dioxygenase, partial [Hyphomicrobiales bacterium]